jgi:hypothetical protein
MKPVFHIRSGVNALTGHLLGFSKDFGEVHSFNLKMVHNCSLPELHHSEIANLQDVENIDNISFLTGRFLGHRKPLCHSWDMSKMDNL